MIRGITFMTTDKSLVSLALIKTNWVEHKKDSIDMLIPFILYSISDLNDRDIVSITDTRTKLYNDFGIDLYNNVIETIFKRIASDRYYETPYLTKESKIYYRTNTKIDTQIFDEKRKSYSRDQSNVINSFYKFLQDREIIFDTNVAKNELISYLCKYGYNLFQDNLSKYETTTIWTKRIGEFIEYIHHNNEDIFNYLKDIAKGGMLSTVYFSGIDKDIKPLQKFKNTVIYFDTPLLMYILNYSGEALQKTVQELLDLLKANGAKVCSFEHNLDELESILEAYVSRYRSGTLNTSYNFDYLIEIDAKPEKIETDIPLLKTELKRKGIIIEETPPYDDYWRNIGFTNFNNYLSEKIHYNKSDRRDNDVESIAAIYRLRSRDSYHYYESCEALFVATNSYLVYNTQKYFKEEGKKGIPAIVDDTFLTSLLWLKDSKNNDTLPTLKLIADALAAQEPSKNFWDKFIIKIDELKERGEITDDEVNELKFGLFSKKNMFDVTEGDASKITHESVKEVQKMNFRMQHKDVLNERDEAISEKNIYQKKYEEANIQLINLKTERYVRKINRAKILSNILGLLIISVIVYFAVNSVTSLFGIFSNIKIITDLGFTAFFLVIGGILNQFVNKAISKKADKISLKILKAYIRKVYNDINANEGNYAEDILLHVKQVTEKTP